MRDAEVELPAFRKIKMLLLMGFAAASYGLLQAAVVSYAEPNLGIPRNVYSYVECETLKPPH